MIRAVIADDQPLARAGLRAMLIDLRSDSFGLRLLFRIEFEDALQDRSRMGRVRFQLVHNLVDQIAHGMVSPKPFVDQSSLVRCAE